MYRPNRSHSGIPTIYYAILDVLSPELRLIHQVAIAEGSSQQQSLAQIPITYLTDLCARYVVGRSHYALYFNMTVGFDTRKTANR